MCDIEVESYDQGLEAGRHCAYLYRNWIDQDIAGWLLDEPNDLSEIERELFEAQLEDEAHSAYEDSDVPLDAAAASDYLQGFRSGVTEQVWGWYRESHGFIDE